MAMQKNVRRHRDYDDSELMHRAEGRKPKGKKPNHQARDAKHNWDRT